MSNMAETAKSSGTNTKVLNRAEALDALKKSTSRNPIKIFAYYSSVLDGIVVPSYGNDDASKDDNLGDLLTVPIDDHMVRDLLLVICTLNFLPLLTFIVRYFYEGYRYTEVILCLILQTSCMVTYMVLMFILTGYW